MATKKDSALSGAVKGDALNFNPDSLVIIGKDTDDGPEHNLYDPRIKLKLSESMILSIMAKGVLENVTIASIDGKPVVVDGRRRVLHAREAQKRMREENGADFVLRVPARVTTDTDAGLFATMIVANSHRLNDDPVAEGKKAALMSERFGASDDEIAKAFGWTGQTLRNRRKLLTLPAKVLRQVVMGNLTVTAALAMADMDPEAAGDLADEMADEAEAKGGKTHGQAKRAKREANPDAEPSIGKRMLQAILATDAAENLSEDVARTLRWICGDVKAVAIKGLSACINEIEAAKKTAMQAKNEAARERIKAKAKKAAPTNKPKSKGGATARAIAQKEASAAAQA